MKITTIFLRYYQRLPLVNLTLSYATLLHVMQQIMKQCIHVHYNVQVSNIHACCDQGQMQIRCVYTYCVAQL